MAQLDRTTLNDNADTRQPNNAAGEIDAVDTRQQDKDLADSAFILDSDDSDSITEGATNLFKTSAEGTKLGFISVTQSVDLDDMESDISTNTIDIATNAASISGLQGANIPQGNWDADTNSPDITGTTETGYYWVISVDGSTNLGGITDWKVNDWAVKSATGWLKVDNTDKIITVANVSPDSNGNVPLAVADITGLSSDLASKADTTQTEQTVVFVRTPEDGTETIILNAGYGFSITEVSTICSSGTCTLEISIGGTPLGGSTNSVSTSQADETHGSANVVNIGDNIEITVSSNASCENMNISLTGERTLA